MGLESIVDVQISTQTAAVTRAGFGTPAVLGFHEVFPERFRIYTSTADMVEDGFSAGSAIVRAVSAILSQNPKVPRVVVGRRDNAPTMKHTLAPAFVEGATYTVTIDGKAAEVTTEAGDTISDLVTDLAAAINLSGADVTASADGTDILLEADSAGHVYSLRIDTTMGATIDVTETTADAGVADDIEALASASSDWYGLVLVEQGKAETLAAAAVIETMRRVMGATSGDSAILDGASTTDIAAELKALGYARTFLLYSPRPYEYAAAAWMGAMFPADPGSATWKFKSLRGVSVYGLTGTEAAVAKDKRANTYTQVGGLSITQEGVTASGEFIDTTRGVDWLQAQLQEGIFSLLANSAKVPYTDGGVALVENIVRGALTRAVGVGLLAEDPAPEVTVPRVADVPQPDRAARHLPDVRFTGTLAGAIHSLTIQGTVSV